MGGGNFAIVNCPSLCLFSQALHVDLGEKHLLVFMVLHLLI